MFRQNKQHRFLRYSLNGTMFVFFSFMSFNILFPVVSGIASTSASTSANLEVDVEPVIEMALDKEALDLAASGGQTEIIPTDEGVVVTGQLGIYVSTNNPSGYNLKIYSSDSTNSMTHANSGISQSIAPTSGGATLAANTWGFQSSNVPGSWVSVGSDENHPQTIINNGGKTSSLCYLSTTSHEHCPSGSTETTTITFGAKITSALPSGRYTNDVVISAITNPGS